MHPTAGARKLLSAIVVAVTAAGCSPAACPTTIEDGAAGDAGCSEPGCPDAQVPPADGACARSQPVLTTDVTNARDLGGIPLAPEGSVACGAIFRGPPLAGLSEDACADVAALGLRTVIDLRQDSERTALPNDPCLTAALVEAPLPIPYGVSPTDYVADFDTDVGIAAVFHTLGDAANYPVYFHCTYGRDRSGVVAAAILAALGASRDDIMQEYERSAASVGAYPDSLAAVLDEIEAQGGIEPALRAKGVSDDELATLRARAIAAF